MDIQLLTQQCEELEQFMGEYWDYFDSIGTIFFGVRVKKSGWHMVQSDYPDYQCTFLGETYEEARAKLQERIDEWQADMAEDEEEFEEEDEEFEDEDEYEEDEE